MNRQSLVGSALLLAGILTACSSTSRPKGAPATTPEPTASAAASSSGAPASPSGAPASPSGAPAASIGSTPASAPTITIKNFGFAVIGPVHPGEKIMVHNEDSEAHTVTADSGNAFNVVVPASSTVPLTAPGKVGSYKFHCNYHANMHGSLPVVGTG